jgi:hypothetical protein
MAVLPIIGDSLIKPERLLHQYVNGESKAITAAINDVNQFNEKGNSSIFIKKLQEIQVQKKFSPIGIGKPLSIELATIYTGDYRRFLGTRKDIILISGVKNIRTFQSTSRAVNLKLKSIEELSYLEFSALEDGTNIVYYTPAMDSESMSVSFELMFDNFDTELFDSLSGLFNTASGIPVFLPAAPYLLGGSQLINIGSRLGEMFFTGKPSLSSTLQIQFQSPILPPTEPREFVLYNEKDLSEFVNLKVAVIDSFGGPKLRLVDKINGEIYHGKAPYLIVLLDGRKREELNAFSTVLASASVLKKFYGVDQKASGVMDVLQDAIKLYNDSIYSAKGRILSESISKVPKGTKTYDDLKNLYQAYALNILTSNFSLPDLPE